LLTHPAFANTELAKPRSSIVYKPMKFNSELRCRDLTIEQITPLDNDCDEGSIKVHWVMEVGGFCGRAIPPLVHWVT